MTVLSDRDPAIAEAPPVVVRIGHSTILGVNRDIKSIINPNPKILTVDVQNRRTVVLFGLVDGSTELRFLDAKGAVFLSPRVVVEPDLAALQQLLRDTLGEPQISLRSSAGSMILSGQVANAGRIAQAAEITQKSLGTTGSFVNLLTSTGNDQVTVAVKVLEIKHANLRNLGIKWTAQNGKSPGGINQLGNVFGTGVLARPIDQFSLAASSTFRIDRTLIDIFVDFLRTEGQAKLLAEPTIVASSGKPAKFLSGGEIPIPVPYGYGGGVNGSTTATGTTVSNTAGGVSNQANNSFSGIIYKQYGTSLNMTATIGADNRIDLQLNPEVSSIDYANAIEYGGNRVPALATRRAETQLRLESGETVIFAGLTSDNTSKSTARLPIGPRFLDFLAGPSTNSDDRVELVILVTPVLGNHVNAGPEAKADLAQAKP